MQRAWIAGVPTAFDAAIAEAAKLLNASRHPLIAGLGTDVAGARAAIALAKRTGAVIDHMNSDALLRELDVMRCSGVMLTTPGEARVRADTLLLVGPGIAEAPSKLFTKLGQSQTAAGADRRIFWLCPGADLSSLRRAGISTTVIGKEPVDLPTLLAALRAHTAGRPTGKTRVSIRLLDQVSTSLRSARFGVAVWSAADLDGLAIEMLCGLVNDLNATTRFSALSLAPADNAVGVLQTCGWLIGLPMRTGFARDCAEHDPWRLDGRRLAASGEADCLLWISAYRAAVPQWCNLPPTIALTTANAAFREPPRVHIEVGRPGVDHQAVEHSASIGTLIVVAATQPSDRVSVANALDRIAAVLPQGGERAC